MDKKPASSRPDNKGEKKPYKKDSRTGDSRPGFKKDARKGGDGDRPKKKFEGSGSPKDFGERRKAEGGDDRQKREDRPKRSFNKEGGDDRPKRSFRDGDDKKPFDRTKKFGDRDGREKKDFDRPKRSFDKEGGEDRPKRSFNKDGGDRKPFDRPKRSFDKEGGEDRPKRSFDKKDGERKSFDRPKRSFDKEGGEDRPKRSFDKGDKKSFDRPKRSFDKEGGEDRPKRAYNKEGGEGKTFDRPKRSFDKEGGDDRPKRAYNKDGGDRPKRSFKDGDKKPFDKKKSFGKNEGFVPGGRKPSKKKEEDDGIEREQFEDKVYGELTEETKVRRRFKGDKDPKPWEVEDDSKEIDGPMMLNKYIAHSGECSRRDAAELVKQGKVRVNGELMLEPGYKVQPGDAVTLSGKKLTPQKDFVYILLNKPKDFITTTDDPQERKTVLDLVAAAEVDRLYPVGRLDRKTTGVLLITNDGALAHKLSHPSYNIKKVYQVTLDKNLTAADYQKISKGVELEDGVATVDALAYLEHRNEVGLEIHSGKNRIVRRIFESLGYEVEKLDRVMYAGLTKKNLPRGKWRFLNEKEIVFLKHFKG